MPDLAEWYHGHQAGFQLFANKGNAGHGTLTLSVGRSRGACTLTPGGLGPDDVQAADYTTTTRLQDPDDNLVVLAQGKA
jgi:hypothetical protein